MGDISEHPRIGAPDEKLVRIICKLDEESWHGFSGEALWAESIGGDRYLIRSAPFYVFDLSVEDIVIARATSEGLVFERVVERGGSSTYRVFVRSGIKDPSFVRFWKPLEKLDCNFELGSRNLLAVDVPPQSDIEQVYAFLEEGESAGVWEFEEGYCGHQVEHSYASWRPQPARA
jgi:hypothetical protein